MTRGFSVDDFFVVRRAGRVAGVVTERGRVACEAVVVAGGAWSSLFLRRHGVEIPQLSVLATVCATFDRNVIRVCRASDVRRARNRSVTSLATTSTRVSLVSGSVTGWSWVLSQWMPPSPSPQMNVRTPLMTVTIGLE